LKLEGNLRRIHAGRVFHKGILQTHLRLAPEHF
jgi:hypothetical protein